MYGDQSGEFVCGYWGLKGLLLSGTLWINSIVAGFKKLL